MTLGKITLSILQYQQYQYSISTVSVEYQSSAKSNFITALSQMTFSIMTFSETAHSKATLSVIMMLGKTLNLPHSA